MFYYVIKETEKIIIVVAEWHKDIENLHRLSHKSKKAMQYSKQKRI